MIFFHHFPMYAFNDIKTTDRICCRHWYLNFLLPTHLAHPLSSVCSGHRLLGAQNQNQKCLLVTRQNDNHSPGPGPERLVSSSHQRSELIKFYSQNTNLLPPKPKSTFRHLKQGIQDFHRKYVLVPADKAANNVVVV